MDKKYARQLCNTLVLAFCICSLAVHFFAEGLSLAASPAMVELAGDGESPDVEHEHTDDDVILSSNHRFSMVRIPTTFIMMEEFFFPSLILPQLTPPKHFAIA
jgi:hypothetical protein